MRKIKDQIKNAIKKNDVLYAITRIIQNRKNPDFIKMYTDMSCCIRVTPKGNSLGRSQVFIYDCDTLCGLFWYLRRVLEVVYYCDQMGLVPQIHWSKSLYYDETIQNTSNPFEYYFCQPIVLSDEVLSTSPIVEYAPDNSSLVRNLLGKDHTLYEGDKAYIEALATVARVALRYNHETEMLIESFLESHRITGDTLGIHARGTDFRKQFKNHPVFIETEEYFQYVDDAIKQHGFRNIFLATDDQIILNEFLEHYPHLNIVYSEDVQRDNGMNGVHINSYINSNSSPYKEGLYALCDMAALAVCGGIISGVSNLPLIARIISSSKNNIYKYDKVINKGLNKTGIDASKLTFATWKKES